MIPGPGITDGEGVYHLGEADNPDLTFSGLMQLVTEPISDQFALDRGRLADLEDLPAWMIVPTAVSAGGLIAADGKVTSTAQATVSIATVFPIGTFTRFECDYDITTSAASGVTGLLRTAAGVDSITGYDNQRETAINNVNTTVQSLNQTAMFLDTIAIAGRHVGKFYLADPNVAAATLGRGEAIATPNPMTAAAGNSRVGIQHRPLTAYTGITFAASAGTITLNYVRFRGVV